MSLSLKEEAAKSLLNGLEGMTGEQEISAFYAAIKTATMFKLSSVTGDKERLLPNDRIGRAIELAETAYNSLKAGNLAKAKQELSRASMNLGLYVSGFYDLDYSTADALADAVRQAIFSMPSVIERKLANGYDISKISTTGLETAKRNFFLPMHLSDA